MFSTMYNLKSACLVLCDHLPPVSALLYYRWLAAGLHDKIISQGIGGHWVYVGIRHPCQALVYVVSFVTFSNFFLWNLTCEILTTNPRDENFKHSKVGFELALLLLFANWCLFKLWKNWLYTRFLNVSYYQCANSYRMKHAICRIYSKPDVIKYPNHRKFFFERQTDC